MKKEKKNKTIVDEPLTISEYERKYSYRHSPKRTNTYLTVAITFAAVFLLLMVFLLFKEVYEVNEYAGYAVGALGLLLYIFFFAIPVIKMMNMPRFDVNVTVYSSRKAKAHNAKMRKELADKIIESYILTKDSAPLYSSESIARLIKARKSHNKNELLAALDNIYNNDVKKEARRIIAKASLNSGLMSAASQKDTLDVILTMTVNLKMVKDILFLYGFRPSEARMAKIFSTILSDGLLAYGISSASTTIVKAMTSPFDLLPIFGPLIDSAIQGLSNAVLTMILGRQTQKYLLKEYNLQNILENTIVTESDEEFINDCEEIKKELKTANKARKEKKQNKEKENHELKKLPSAN